MRRARSGHTQEARPAGEPDRIACVPIARRRSPADRSRTRRMPIPPETPRRGIAAAGTPGPGLAMLQGALLVVAVLYFARELLIPLVLSVLVAFVLAPVMRAFRRFGLPRVAAVLLAVLLGFIVVLGIGALMGRQATQLAENIPTYQSAVTTKLRGLNEAGGLLDRISGTMAGLGAGLRHGGKDGAEAVPPGDGGPSRATADPDRQAPTPVVIREPDPTALETVQRLAEPLLHPLATTGIVLVLVIFILLYREDLRDRLIRLAGARDLHRTMAAMDDAAYRLSRYFLAQVAMNAGFGVFIGAMLWLIGIPGAPLWGFVAGLMRFVPFVGSYIAAAVPALLALAVDPGWTTVILVVVLFAASEITMGQVFEPWIFGHSTGLSPIAVIAAATFWTWLWGPVGLLLAVPLTVCLVVLGRHVDRLEFLEVMLGDQPALDPEETFYQRALAGDVDALAEQSERCLKDTSLEAYLDSVALPALRLAQADAQRDAVAPERLDQLRQTVLTLLEDLEEAEERRPAADAAAEAGAEPPLPQAWRGPGAVQCLAGRGPFDALLAATLAQCLALRGFGVQLGGGGPGGVALPTAPPRLACLCLMEGGASAATARYLLRRTRRRLPGVPVLALAWRPEAAPEGPIATGLRAEDPAAQVLLAASLGETLDLATDAAAGGTAVGDAGGPAAEQAVARPAPPVAPLPGAPPPVAPLPGAPLPGAPLPGAPGTAPAPA